LHTEPAGALAEASAAFRGAYSDLASINGSTFHLRIRPTARHGFFARVRIKRFGTRRVAGENGRDLGDIDVLAVDDKRRQLWAIDAKAVGTAINQREVAREIKSSWGGSGERSSAHRHVARPVVGSQPRSRRPNA